MYLTLYKTISMELSMYTLIPSRQCLQCTHWLIYAQVVFSSCLACRERGKAVLAAFMDRTEPPPYNLLSHRTANN